MKITTLTIPIKLRDRLEALKREWSYSKLSDVINKLYTQYLENQEKPHQDALNEQYGHDLKEGNGK